MFKPLLIEIGVEELPAVPFLKELPNIETKWANILKENALSSEFEFYYTPRRLVLWHPKFPLSQEDRTEEFYGAPVNVAFKEGEPTPAALGFAKKCGVSLEELDRATKGGKEVLYYEKLIPGVKSELLIQEMVAAFINSLNFGKSMRWGSINESFIRPIRWIGTLFGNEAIPFSLFNVKAQSISYPHRSTSYEPFSYASAQEYFEKLENSGVILSQEKRKVKVLEEFETIQKNENLTIEMDEDLLAEIVAITEYPKALLGSFDEEFLRLPPEVIVTSMKEHQRYFPVTKEGKITNKFIVVSNAISDDYELIVKGNEKVLRARLSDGLFFFENDLKRGLSIAGLKDIVYLDGLGSVFDKVIREKNIVDYLQSKYKRNLAIKIDYKDEKECGDLLNRAIMLSKADLLTEMVYEFTELQGLMGYYYAQAGGDDALVALALKEQYLPDSEESELPSNLFSALIALANKMDSLLALFSIGKIPTGTKDPFALRRAANGIIKIVLDQNLSFDIQKEFEALSKNYAGFDIGLLENFFMERIYKFFDANPSVIKAVLGSGERDLVRLEQKIAALKKVVESEDFKEVFSTFKRVANIIKSVDIEADLQVDEKLFESAQEEELFKAFNKVSKKEYASYEEELKALFSLKPQIDAFFDHVMVNVDNTKLKQNRQHLIASIYKAFRAVADIKEITV